MNILTDTIENDISDGVFHRIAADRADTGLIIQTLDGIVVWANPAYLKMMKLRSDQVVGQSPLRFAFAPEDRLSEEEIDAFRFDPYNYVDETEVVRKNIRGDGTRILLNITLSFYPSAKNAQYAVIVAREVTQEIARENKLRETNARLNYIASHDSLTNVANRDQLSRSLGEMLKEAATENTQFGVMHIDLDRFKEINDTHGHSAGDAVLKAVAERLQSNVRGEDLVARVGGDEFVVVCANIQHLEQLQNIGNSFLKAVEDPILWNGSNLHCGLSIGVALSDASSDSIEDILTKSDFALYDAKSSGRGRVALYNQELHEKYAFESVLAVDLKSAVAKKDIGFKFQPIVDAATGKTCAFETLVRWEHPKYGPLAPASCLPTAQHIGVMADIDFMAIEAALDLKCQINECGFETVKVAVNASAEVLSHPLFVDRLCQAIDQRGLLRDSIIVEILETVVFQDAGSNGYSEVLERISQAGMNVVLDDLGSGNIGLAQLSKLKVTGIKTDKSLVDNITNDRAAEAVYRALVNLCFELGLKVTTEGIESKEQAFTVAQIGTQTMQGYWYGHALANDDAIDHLLRQKHKPARTAAQTATQTVGRAGRQYDRGQAPDASVIAATASNTQ
ncbi:MAG: EAL domain-containing protein [Pseudomonadota bacterium]